MRALVPWVLRLTLATLVLSRSFACSGSGCGSSGRLGGSGSCGPTGPLCTYVPPPAPFPTDLPSATPLNPPADGGLPPFLRDATAPPPTPPPLQSATTPMLRVDPRGTALYVAVPNAVARTAAMFRVDLESGASRALRAINTPTTGPSFEVCGEHLLVHTTTAADRRIHELRDALSGTVRGTLPAAPSSAASLTADCRWALYQDLSSRALLARDLASNTDVPLRAYAPFALSDDGTSLYAWTSGSDAGALHLARWDLGRWDEPAESFAVTEPGGEFFGLSVHAGHALTVTRSACLAFALDAHTPWSAELAPPCSLSEDGASLVGVVPSGITIALRRRAEPTLYPLRAQVDALWLTRGQHGVLGSATMARPALWFSLANGATRGLDPLFTALAQTAYVRETDTLWIVERGLFAVSLADGVLREEPVGWEPNAVVAIPGTSLLALGVQGDPTVVLWSTATRSIARTINLLAL